MRAINHKITILILSLFLAPQLLAQKSQTFEFDDNKDKVIDNIFRYADGTLVEHLNDRNYDNKFDYEMRVRGSITEIKADNNFDGNFDRMEIIEAKGDYSLYRLYDLIKGRKNLIIEKKISNTQHNEEAHSCNYENYLSSISTLDNLITDFDPIIESVNNGLYSFSPGVEIHKSCLENFGEQNFGKIVRNAFDKGMSCLSEIAANNKEMGNKGEIRNIINLLNIQMSGKVKPTSIICHDKNYDWDRTYARASTGKTSLKDLGITSPFISINPEMKSGMFGSIKNGPPRDEFEGVVFHEFLHNLGYRHGQGVDVAYGCEVCCFSDNKAAKVAACNMCIGGYDPKNAIDSNHLRDMAIVSKETGLITSEIYIYNNIKQIPINQENIDSIFIGLATRGEGVQQEFMKQVAKRGYSITNKGNRLKKLIKDVDRYRPVNDFIKEANKIYVEALLIAYFDRNPARAKRILAKQIPSSGLYDIADRNERDSASSRKLARGVEIIEQLF